MRKINKYGMLMVVMLSIAALAACGGGSSFGDYNTSREEGGVEFTNEYSSPGELGAGDLMYVNFDASGYSTLDFTGVSDSAKFFLVVGSASESGTSTTFQISSDLSAVIEEDVSAQIVEGDEYTADEILSIWLRTAEYDLAATEPNHFGKAIGLKDVGEFKAASVGDTESFRVLSNLSSTTTYTTVDGSVRCVGNAVIFYVDPRVGSDLLSDSEIASLCGEFDDVAQKEQALLGEASDINGEGKIAVLMTPQINRLGFMGGGIITGYFWAGDLYDRSSANPVSNMREIIYTMVPDPSGSYGTVISKDFALSNLLPAVLPHELQHAISYNQHVFVKGTPPEQNWLNEGLSHLSEDLMGYGQENPSRYALYLANTTQGGVVTMRQPNLYERGASYLFLRYLYEQAADGDRFLGNLETSGLLGVDNLEQSFAGGAGFSKFYELLARWTAAVALTDEGVTLDRRFIYETRVKNSQTGNWQGVCLKCDAEDGRGTILNGVSKVDYSAGATLTVSGSAAKFYALSDVGSQMIINGVPAQPNFGVLIRTE